MWEPINRWRRRRAFRGERRTIRFCKLYVVDDFGLALPAIPLRVIVPVGPVFDACCVNMRDTDAIGARIIAALDYVVAEQERSVVSDYKKTQWEFLDGMERFRQVIGVGKRRFESRMELLGFTCKSGEISVTKRQQAHGRFAFKGTKSARDQTPVSATAAKGEIGQAVQALLGKETQKTGH